MKKMRKRSKTQKPENKKMIPGDHTIRFFRDMKSGHPYLSVSRAGDKYFGHDMTSHPSLKESGTPRMRYQKMHKNPNPDDKRTSYYNRRIKRVLSKGNHFSRLRLHPKWKISNRDLRVLRNIDKHKIKNVRRDDN